MSNERALVCRAAGQVGILAGSATAIACDMTLPSQFADSNILGLGGLYILCVLCAVFVFWASCDQRRRRAALGGCAVLVFLHMTIVALLQSLTHMYSLWGAVYLLAPALFPLGSLALLAFSYRDPTPGMDHEPELVLAGAWLYGLALPLLLVNTLASWLIFFDLPGAFLASVVGAAAFYVGLRRLSRPSCLAQWEPVAALVNSLAVIEYGLFLLLAVLGPHGMNVSAGGSIACASAVAITLCLIALQVARARSRTAAGLAITPAGAGHREPRPANQHEPTEHHQDTQRL